MSDSQGFHDHTSGEHTPQDTHGTASKGTETDLDIEGIPLTTGRLYFRVRRE